MKKVQNIIFIVLIITLFSAGGLFFLRKKKEILKKQKELSTSEIKEDKVNQTTEFPSDNKKGCIFSLRYDDLNKVNTDLKQEAKTEINKIKNQLGNGADGEETLSLLMPEITAEDYKTYFENRKNNKTEFKFPENPYEKFQVNEAVNFCFENSQERYKNLGEFFYEINPSIEKQLDKLSPREISEPFLIYKTSSKGVIDYAWAIILREK